MLIILVGNAKYNPSSSTDGYLQDFDEGLYLVDSLKQLSL